MCYWRKCRHKVPCCRIEGIKINTHIYSQMILENAKTIEGERTVFSKIVLGQLDIHMQKKMIF